MTSLKTPSDAQARWKCKPRAAGPGGPRPRVLVRGRLASPAECQLHMGPTVQVNGISRHLFLIRANGGLFLIVSPEPRLSLPL